jgi:hypothetical protein
METVAVVIDALAQSAVALLFQREDLILALKERRSRNASKATGID